jgi:hypothetical protein
MAPQGAPLDAMKTLALLPWLAALVLLTAGRS